MSHPSPPGLFITGTDTGVGKTFVAALIARRLAALGLRVGVYKPVASGCRLEGGTLVSDDALALWEAAGRPGTLDEVCPQRFAAPLAPNLAARQAGQSVDAALLRRGIESWRRRSGFVLVEGAGGLLSPLTDQQRVAELADELGYPLLIVAANRIGVINQVLQTLIAAGSIGCGLPVIGVVLNRPTPADDDPSVESNDRELARWTNVPVLADIPWQAEACDELGDRLLELLGLAGHRTAASGKQTGPSPRGFHGAALQ